MHEETRSKYNFDGVVENEAHKLTSSHHQVQVLWDVLGYGFRIYLQQCAEFLCQYHWLKQKFLVPVIIFQLDKPELQTHISDHPQIFFLLLQFLFFFHLHVL